MDRTKKAFLAAEKKGLIKLVNRQIKNISFRGIGYSCCVDIELYDDNNHHYDDFITMSCNEFSEFVVTVFIDDRELDTSNWSSTDLRNKYIRLCYYMTPESEMHELADATELVAIKHICFDDSDCEYTFLLKNKL